MQHLFVKEFLTQRKIAYLVPVLLLPYFMTLGKNIPDIPIAAIAIQSLSVSFIAYFMAMYSNFNTTQGETMQTRLLLSLPVTRREIVNVKYLMIGVWWLIAYISYTVLLTAMQAFHLYDSHPFDFHIAVLSLCFSYLLTSVFYPLHYLFGYRVGSMLGIVMFFLLSSGFGKIVPLIGANPLIPVIVEWPTVSFAVITLLFVMASYLISVRAFLKKDF